MTFGLVEELQSDIRRGLRIAHELTQETQTVMEACTDLVRLVRKAREERDVALAEASKLRDALEPLANFVRSIDSDSDDRTVSEWLLTDGAIRRAALAFGGKLGERARR